MFGAFVALVGAVRFVSSQDYPAGDWRNDPTAWAISKGLFFVIGVLVALSGIWGLDRRE